MRITGTDSDDTLTGTAQADTIRGLGGDDTIFSNGGADLIYGGAGDDMIFLRQSGAFAYGEEGDDTFVPQELSLSATPTTIDGGAGTDTFDASGIVGGGDDYLQFAVNPDTGALQGGGYALIGIEVIRGPNFGEVAYFLDDNTPMTIYGGTGDDFVSAVGRITFDGGAGDDSIFMNASGSRAKGGNGDDIFILDALGGATGIRVGGGAGRDLIAINADAVDLRLKWVESNAGVRYAIKSIEDVDVSNAHNGATITGSDAGNLITVRSVTDADQIAINGFGGNDTINGSDANDTIFGGDGDDFITGFTGFDVIDGGAGHDFASFGASNAGPLQIRLSETRTTEVTAGGKAIATLTSIEDAGGSQQSDVVVGNALDNQLVGNGGDDRLLGGAGGDMLVGGAGRDTLVGGDGADRFVYQYRTESSPDRALSDRIQDFHQSEGDHIVLDFDAQVYAEGRQHFTFIGQDAFSGHGGELRFDIVGNTTFVSADTDGDAHADLTIKLVGAIPLTAADFVL